MDADQPVRRAAGAPEPRRRAHLGRDRRPALRPRLPARLPADRQPARRRGPHPGGLRPRLPLPVDVHARHLRGLAAPDHHQPLPRPGPPQAADPLRRPLRRARGPAAQRAADARTRRTPTRPSTTTSSARWRPCRRTSAPPSCSATSRACPTRRSPRSSTPSSAPSAPASTAAAPCCAPRWPTGPRPRAARATRARPPRRPTSHAGDRVVIGHLGARVSALLDGQLSPADEERAWAHVHSCHQCRDAVEREGWVKTRLADLQLAPARTRPSHLKGSLLVRGLVDWPAPARPPRARGRRRSAGGDLGDDRRSAAAPSAPP